MPALTRFASKPLEHFVEKVLLALEAPQEIASEVARHLIRANLSGHDSHGVMRMRQYVQQADAGMLVPSARPKVLRQKGSSEVIDAQRGMGHYSTLFALERAMESAAEHGVATAAIRHSTHIGRVGEYPERAAERGFVAIVAAGAAGMGVGGMAPWGGTERFITPSPWAIGIPLTGRAPFVFDAAMTTVAQGKVKVAHDQGVELPPGCLVDSEGQASTRPKDFYEGGTMLPLGGDVAGHKGFALALAAAFLGGLGMIDDADPTLIGAAIQDDAADPRGRVGGVFLVVLAPACFGDAGRYQSMVTETVEAMKKVRRAEGVEAILYPGEIEHRTRAERQRDGILLPEVTVRELAEIGERFGVPAPH